MFHNRFNQRQFLPTRAFVQKYKIILRNVPLFTNIFNEIRQKRERQ
jgi:hypothetical protein